MTVTVNSTQDLAADCSSSWQVALPTGHLQVTVQHARQPLDTLLGFAARANAKRGFLFVSRVLGKHWPVRPQDMHAIHQDLASQIPPDLAGPVLFIALAETAIGLGQGVFEAYLANTAQTAQPGPQALFLHSSRYRAGALSDAGVAADGLDALIEFAEAHSHAPRQFLHVPQDAGLRALLRQAKTLVLVDDEASTGNTFVNLCHALRGCCPDLGHVHLAVITDFMGQETRCQLPQRFGLPTSIGATLSGHYQFEPGQMQPSQQTAQRFDASGIEAASIAFGRMGIARALGQSPAMRALVARLCQQIAANETVLVLGTGEFMHPAFLLAQALEQAGLDVRVQATTRSPILIGGAITACLQFPDNYGEGIVNYLYNVVPGQYQHVLICHETSANAALHQLAHTLHGRLLHFSTGEHIEEIPVC